MRIKSPVGEYDYRVTAVRLGRDGMEIDGSLGQWQTTMVVGPGELARAAAPIAALLALGIVLSRRR
jgi:hypothetical protein